MSDQEPADTAGLASAPKRVGAADPTPHGPAGRSPREDEFAAFYRGFVTRLVGFLIWQGSPACLAADLAQETMIQAWRQWETIEHPDAWARRVASRGLVRHFSRTEEDPVAQPPQPTSLAPNPDRLTEWENNQQILDLLAKLPPRQRQVLAWSVDGFSPTEIATELGITPETVRGNLLKARRSVARLMGHGQEDTWTTPSRRSPVTPWTGDWPRDTKRSSTASPDS